MDTNSLLVILSSSVLAALISGLVASATSRKLAESQYRNDYFKIVVSKRVSAYEEVERLITSLKAAVLDDDQALYHAMMCFEGSSQHIQERLMSVIAKSLWISPDLVPEIRALNTLLLRAPYEKAELVAYCKQHYEFIAGKRATIERLLSRDMSDLHNVQKFLRLQQKNTHRFERLES